MKTAVEYLVEQLNEIGFHTIVIQSIIDKAKEMEKEQSHAEYMRGWKDGLTKQQEQWLKDVLTKQQDK